MEPVWDNIYVHNGWPILERGGVYYTPKGKYFTRKSLVEDLTEEPEFVLPWYSYKGFNVDPEAHKFGSYGGFDAEKVVVGFFAPARPDFQDGEVSPGSLVPGFDGSLGTFRLDGFFEVYNRVRTIRLSRYVASAGAVAFREIPFAECICDVVIPWKDRSGALSEISVKGVPKKYLRNCKELPFSKKFSRSINYVYSDYGFTGRDVYFVGWKDGVTFALLLSEEYDGKREWYLYYSKKVVDNQTGVNVLDFVIGHSGEPLTLSEEEIRSLDGVDELVDFVLF